jgi:hypothetical protein
MRFSQKDGKYWLRQYNKNLTADSFSEPYLSEQSITEITQLAA